MLLCTGYVLSAKLCWSAGCKQNTAAVIDMLAGRDLRRTLVQCPAQSRTVTKAGSGLVSSNKVLKISRDGYSLFWITASVKLMSYLELPGHNHMAVAFAFIVWHY